MSKKKYFLIPLIIIGVILMGVLIGLSGNKGISKGDTERIKSAEYDAVFFAMYDVSGFQEEDFSTYRGLGTIRLESELNGFKEISECFETIWKTEKDIDSIYLGIDPVQLWEKASGSEEKWVEKMTATLGSAMEQHPEVTFEVMLSFPYISYWTDMQEEQLTESLLVYQKTVDMLGNYPNAVVFFPGGEEWLNYNRTNYGEDVFVINEGIAAYLLRASFCDRLYQVDSDSMSMELQKLRTVVEREKTTPITYADLSNYDIVFIGDSIVRLENTTSSIPNLVNALSGAGVYNFAHGGAPASFGEDCEFSMDIMVEALVKEQFRDLSSELDFVQEIERFLGKETESEKLCFVINFGLNDFFLGRPVEDAGDSYNIVTYGGALRSGVEKLKEAYPQAQIVIMAPNYTEFHNGGTEKQSEYGGILTDYVKVAEQVASDMGVLYKNNYEDFRKEAEDASVYLLDGCHLNGTGRLMYARQLIEFLGENLDR